MDDQRSVQEQKAEVAVLAQRSEQEIKEFERRVTQQKRDPQSDIPY